MKRRPKRSREEILNKIDNDDLVEPYKYVGSSTPRKMGWFFIIIGTMVLGGLVLGITAGGMEWIAVVPMTVFVGFMYFIAVKIISAPNTTAAELEAADLEQEVAKTQSPLNGDND